MTLIVVADCPNIRYFLERRFGDVFRFVHHTQ